MVRNRAVRFIAGLEWMVSMSEVTEKIGFGVFS